MVDTAGIRSSEDAVESIGVEKSLEKMKLSDIVLYMFDCVHETLQNVIAEQEQLITNSKKFILVDNKLDLMNADDTIQKFNDVDALFISAKEDTHVNLLK